MKYSCLFLIISCLVLQFWNILGLPQSSGLNTSFLLSNPKINTPNLTSTVTTQTATQIVTLPTAVFKATTIPDFVSAPTSPYTSVIASQFVTQAIPQATVAPGSIVVQAPASNIIQQVPSVSACQCPIPSQASCSCQRQTVTNQVQSNVIKPNNQPPVFQANFQTGTIPPQVNYGANFQAGQNQLVTQANMNSLFSRVTPPQIPNNVISTSSGQTQHLTYGSGTPFPAGVPSPMSPGAMIASSGNTRPFIQTNSATFQSGTIPTQVNYGANFQAGQNQLV
ncbi:hypothetical protein HMI56_002271, partial [Coelomomyces lativittatus]